MSIGKSLVLSIAAGALAVSVFQPASRADAPAAAAAGHSELKSLAERINQASEISFAATYVTIGANGKSTSYAIDGKIARPNLARIAVSPARGSVSEPTAVLTSNGTTYQVAAPGKKQYVEGAASASSVDSDSTEANYFLYDVVGGPGVAAQDLAEMLLPADFDVDDETVPAGIVRTVTTTSSAVEYGGRSCVDVNQTVAGVRHTLAYHTLISRSDGALAAAEVYNIDPRDATKAKLMQRVVFTRMELLPARQAAGAFSTALPATYALYHAAAAPGMAAPDFTVARANGSKVKLSDYKGKVVVIDFWATWCPPCLATLPGTDKLAAKYQPQGVVFLPVCTWDTKARFQAWLPKHADWAMPWLFDEAADDQGKSIAETKYAVSGIPTQCVIGKDGKIVYRGFADSPAGEQPLVDAVEKAMSAS